MTKANIGITIQLHHVDHQDGVNLHANHLPGVGENVYSLEITEGLYLDLVGIMLTADQIHRLAAQLADISQDIMRADDERKEHE